MKAKNLFHRKFIYNDLLALAIAGIISLLFAQTAYGFFSTSYKKQEDQTARQSYIDQSCYGHSNAETDFIKQGHKLLAQFETHSFEAFCVPQFLRLNVFARVKRIKAKAGWWIKTQFNNVVPPVRRLYIPILYCKLVI